MKESGSLVSVIIPAYNSEKYIKEAVGSVGRQTYKNVEIIVVDDGSIDGTANVVKECSNVRYFYKDNGGISSARNMGVRESKGDYIAFLDSDDLWTPIKIESQMKTFAERSELDIVFGLVKQFISPDCDEETKNKLECPEGNMPGYLAGTMLIKKDSFLKVGFFDDKWRVGEYIDWYARAVELKLQSVMLNDIVLKRRLHGNNIGSQHRDLRTDFIKIVRASLDRKRIADS